MALLLASPPARAQPVDAPTKAAARGVAEEALKLYDKGDYAGAYEKATRANDLVHAPTTALLMGRCLEKLGRLVEASETYLEAAQASLEPSASAAQKKAQVEAGKARAALLPRLASVELLLDPPAPDAQVILDSKFVPPTMLGLKRPLDPGKHTVAVARRGESATQEFTLKEAEAVRVVLKAPNKPGAAYYGPPPGGPFQPVMMYPGGSAPPSPVMVRRSTALYVTGIVLIPIGSLLTLGGALSASDSKHEAASIGYLSGGLAALTGGIVLVIVGGKKVPADPSSAYLDLDPRHSPPAPKASVTPLLGPMSGVHVQF